MGFRIVPRSTDKIDMGDGDYIEVRKGLSKGDFRKILERLPDDFSDENKGFNPAEAEEFTTGVFDALVVSWSAKDEEGKAIPATLESYLTLLDRETAQEVDLKLFEYFNALGVSEAEGTKSGKTSR
jgi:hypothetical protein